ncbi:hypothetical protein [Streptomyces sp. NPDC086838]|uniref:hypothetical protein n=1 Tax=Streptomyces sp. NPDC086838 TaxID=3365762 RepID=UPI003811C758
MNTTTHLDLILGETVTATTAAGLTPADAPVAPKAPAEAPVITADILTTTAARLRTQPRRILTTPHLIATILDTAGPAFTETSLRPLWAALPHHPDGDEHGEYAALLDMIAADFPAAA